MGFQSMITPNHPNYSLLSKLLKMAPSPQSCSLDNVICGLDIKLIYPPAKSSVINSPLDILVEGRKLLSELTRKMSNVQPLAQPANEVRSISQLYNTQMLHTINSIREGNVKLCVNLLGAFMEEQMQVPLKRTSFDTAQAIFSAVSVAAMGVWALFNLSFQDVNRLLSSMPNKQLFVQVAEYIKGMFKENKVNLDREYAGKLQFMVQGLDKTVSCNSQYISYSLERQLVLLCHKHQISALTPTETLVDKWDDLFKDNVLSLVSISHRPLVARWMRWALMVHNLREELARYTAVGVVGLVNSGKSKLVNSLFGIKVVTGTTECKHTTVPFLYNLDQVVEGLDVIDFPGVDARDETIPDLAELLISLAQVVIFVVDYRRVHTVSVKHWLEHLEKEPVQVLVCLTHVDQLYVEYMDEDDKGHVTHRPADIVRRELKIQLDMIKEKLGSCPRHTIQFYSICQGKDSILNTPEGRKILRDVSIGSPLDVGDWLVNVLDKHLDQRELSERLKEYIYKDQ